MDAKAYFIAAAVVLLIWIIYSIRNIQRNPDGYIRINTNDPEKDTYTLELMIPFGELDNRKSVYFKVVKD